MDDALAALARRTGAAGRLTGGFTLRSGPVPARAYGTSHRLAAEGPDLVPPITAADLG